MTAYQRVLDSDFVSKEKKESLQMVHQTLNPVRLSKQIDQMQETINLALKRLKGSEHIPKNLPLYKLTGAILENNNIVSPYQVFHHAKSLESFSLHNFGYDDL